MPSKAQPADAPAPSDPDRALRAALAAGDDALAMMLLVREHGEHVYRYCRRMLGNPADGDDVSQTVFVQVFHGLKDLSRVNSVRSWLFAIARNRCLDRLKAVRRGPQIADHAIDAVSDDAGAAIADDVRVRKALDDCLDQLDARSRAVLVLRFHDGLSYDQISALTSDTPGALRVRVTRALPALRRCLEHKGVAP
jgi:RNA polymerase sigma-70 factor, ECF subfamily